MLRVLLYSCCVSVVVQGCFSPQVPVRVLEKGESMISTSIALVNNPETISFTGHGGSKQEQIYPAVSVGYCYGLTNDVSLHTTISPFTLPFGWLTGHIGGSARITREEGVVPELTATLRGQVFFGGNEPVRAIPSIGITASYQVSQRIIGYFGTNTMYNMPVHEASAFSPTVYGGITSKKITSKVRAQLELGYILANYYSTSKGVLYCSLTGNFLL